MESIWEGPELFLMSADEAKSDALQRSHPLDPNMVQPRAPNTSFCKGQSKVALEKAMKRIFDGMTGDKPAAINDESGEGSDEELASKHKTPVTCHSTTSSSIDLKPNYLPTMTSSHPPTSPTLTDLQTCPIHPSLALPPMSPTSDTDPFASDDDSLSSDDSIF